MEHINETNGKEKLKKYIVEFFELENIDFDLCVDVFTEKDQSQKPFQSFAEKRREEIEERTKKKEANLKANEMVIKAQQIFNSSLDKVVVTKE